jgi:predicted kinase
MPPIALNLRGTSGSGKSHLARRLIAHYPSCEPSFVVGRKQPVSYLCTGTGPHALFVLGHYESDHGGGADTVSRKLGFELLMQAAELGYSTLWEGVIFSDELVQTIALSRRLETHIILLSTPIEQCLADIRSRREARGNEKPLSEKNTRDRVATITRVCDKLKYAQAEGIKKQHVQKLDREAAYQRCLELLGLHDG